jgi:hypothetical protein
MIDKKDTNGDRLEAQRTVLLNLQEYVLIRFFRIDKYIDNHQPLKQAV